MKGNGVDVGKLYGYSINLDERGDFYADVRNERGETVFEIKAGNSLDEDEASIFEVGYMKHKHDLAGLTDYLRSLNIIPDDAKIVYLDEQERHLDAAGDEYEVLFTSSDEDGLQVVGRPNGQLCITDDYQTDYVRIDGPRRWVRESDQLGLDSDIKAFLDRLSESAESDDAVFMVLRDCSSSGLDFLSSIDGVVVGQADTGQPDHLRHVKLTHAALARFRPFQGDYQIESIFDGAAREIDREPTSMTQAGLDSEGAYLTWCLHAPDSADLPISEREAIGDRLKAVCANLERIQDIANSQKGPSSAGVSNDSPSI